MNNKKTALVLSGGGSRGAYEAGVWQALTELGIKIDLVTGTSVGAINSAMVAQGNLELTTKLWKEIETHMVFDVPKEAEPLEYAKEIVINKGIGSKGLKQLMDKYIDEDAVRNSPVDFGIVVVQLPNFQGKRVFKEDIPKGQLVDYVMASASLYPAIQSYEIDNKEYIDGGYADVIPVDMALKRGATHVIAVDLKGKGYVNREALANAPNLIMIRSPWDLGSVLVFDVDNSRKLLRLGYLDAMKAFNIMDGNYFAFAKATFDKQTLKMADFAAKVFDMDPTILYTKEIFLEKIEEAVKAADFDKAEAVLQNPSEAWALLTSRDFHKEMKNFANKKALTFLIAQNIKDKGVASIFLTKGAIKLMPEYILAARFLIKNNLI